MKKTVLLLFSILVANFAFSQERLSYSEVIQVKDINKHAIYDGITDWLSLNNGSGEYVIELEDKESSTIILNSKKEFKYVWPRGYTGWLNYTVKIQCRDGRFKVQLTNFRHEIPTESDSKYKLGLLTTSEEYPTKDYAMKSLHNKAWNRLKEEARKISTDFYPKLKKINFSKFYNADDDDDDW